MAAYEKSNPLPDSARYNVHQPHSGGDRNAVALYAFPEQRVTRHFITEHPLRVSALRGLGAHANVFAIESFMGELAAEAGVDPVDFRIQHLEDPRARAVLEAVRELADRSGVDTDTADATGRGVAFARYKNTSAYLPSWWTCRSTNAPAPCGCIEPSRRSTSGRANWRTNGRDENS